MAKITIHLDTASQAELTESREFLDQLIALGGDDGLSGVEKGGRASGPGSDLAQKAVEDLFGRTGDSAREFVITAAAIEGPFTMSDIAERLSRPVSKVVSQFAVLGRSTKRTKERVPGAPPFFLEQDETPAGWTFVMPQEIRDAVQRKAGEG